MATNPIVLSLFFPLIRKLLTIAVTYIHIHILTYIYMWSSYYSISTCSLNQLSNTIVTVAPQCCCLKIFCIFCIFIPLVFVCVCGNCPIVKTNIIFVRKLCIRNRSIYRQQLNGLLNRKHRKEDRAKERKIVRERERERGRDTYTNIA